MLKKTKIKIGAAIATGLMGFTAIGTSVGIIENQKTNTQITNNIKTSVIKNDNLTNNKFGTAKNEINMQAYLNKISLKQVQSYINKDINNQNNEFVVVNNQNAKYQAEVKTKANLLLKQIFEHKISINILLKELQQKQNSLSKVQKENLQNKIDKVKKQINNSQNLLNDNFAVVNKNNSLNFNAQAAQNFENKQQVFLNEILGFASTMTAITAAASIVAVVDWFIPFWGWFAGPFATAAVVADGITTGLTWANYTGLNNMYSNLSGYLTTGVTVGLTATDIEMAEQDLTDYAEKAGMSTSEIVASATTDEATNITAEFADPADFATVVVLQSIDIALDVAMSVVSIATTISQIFN